MVSFDFLLSFFFHNKMARVSALSCVPRNPGSVMISTFEEILEYVYSVRVEKAIAQTVSKVSSFSFIERFRSFEIRHSLLPTRRDVADLSTKTKLGTSIQIPHVNILYTDRRPIHVVTVQTLKSLGTRNRRFYLLHNSPSGPITTTR